VTRLSIIIPALADDQSLENGLVSVLEHRPDSSEVIVVFDRDYADPYGLREELRFIRAADGAGLLDCFRLGCRESSGEVVHLLAAGLEVEKSWADEALALLARPSVGAVAPALAIGGPESDAIVAGWTYSAAGKLRLAIETAAAETCPTIIAPTKWAGFYRRETLPAAGQWWNRPLGEDLAIVDLGLRMVQAGYEVRFAPQSHVNLPGPLPHEPRGFRAGLRQERLYWGHPPVGHAARPVAAHAWLCCRELLSADFAGRIAGATEALVGRLLRLKPKVPEIAARSMASAPGQRETRIDSGHPIDARGSGQPVRRSA
jgi:hypothetical protein